MAPRAVRLLSFLVDVLVVCAGAYTAYDAFTEEDHVGPSCELVRASIKEPAECVLRKGDPDEMWNATTLLICACMVVLGLACALMELLDRLSVAQRALAFLLVGSFATARGSDIRRDDGIMLGAGITALVLSIAAVGAGMALGNSDDASAAKRPLLAASNRDEGEDAERNPFLDGGGRGRE